MEDLGLRAGFTYQKLSAEMTLFSLRRRRMSSTSATRSPMRFVVRRPSCTIRRTGNGVTSSPRTATALPANFPWQRSPSRWSRTIRSRLKRWSSSPRPSRTPKKPVRNSGATSSSSCDIRAGFCSECRTRDFPKRQAAGLFAWSVGGARGLTPPRELSIPLGAVERRFQTRRKTGCGNVLSHVSTAC